ncbi:hypothetical protein SO694_00028153 [Aureococcus anophagefferens]|uniref:GB1/RHD3-type G domain-containing protein n=1 Tax=Aureococcus anophagefferens TaxID=44056 RepID=A0ABR1FVG6_AURAN
MDTEGLASADQDDSYDAKIFALALLLSSYFVLNVVGVIDDATIERLHLVSEVTKRVVVEGEPTVDDEDEAAVLDRSAAALAAHFPPLLVLVRDLALKPTRDGQPITDAEYLEDALRDRGGDAGDNKKALRHARRDAIRRSLRRVVPSGAARRHLGAPRERRGRAPPSDVPRRRRAAARVRRQVRGFTGGARPRRRRGARRRARERKIACGAAATGASLAALARLHVASINAGAAPSIRGAWDAAAREVNARPPATRKSATTTTSPKNPPDDDDAPARGLPEVDDPAHGAVEDRFAVYEVHKDGAKKAMAVFDGAGARRPDRPARRKKLRVALDRAGKAVSREFERAVRRVLRGRSALEAAGRAHDEMIASAGRRRGPGAGLGRPRAGPRPGLPRARRLRHLRTRGARLIQGSRARSRSPGARGAAELADATARVEADRDAKVAAAEGRAARGRRCCEADARARAEADAAAALRGRNEALAADLDACRDAKRAAEDAGDGERRRADDAEALALTLASADDAAGEIATLETAVAALEADVAAKDDALGVLRRELRDAAAAASPGGIASPARRPARASTRARAPRTTRPRRPCATATPWSSATRRSRRPPPGPARRPRARDAAERARAARQGGARGVGDGARRRDDGPRGRRGGAGAARRAAAAAAAGVLGIWSPAARDRARKREAYLGAKVAAAERRADRAQSAADDARAASPAPVKAVRRLFSVGSEVMDKLGGAWLAHVDGELESFDPDAGTPPKPSADLPGFPTA